MSRQQSRASGDGAIDPSLVQKKRARHRLVGAICLCILAAIVVPMVLESEPRPRDQELPIELAAASSRGDGQARHEAATGAASAAAGTPATSAPAAGAAEPGTPARPSGAVTSGQIGNLPGKPAGGPAGQGSGSAAAESQSAVKTVTPPSAAGAPPAAPRDPRSTAEAAKVEPPRSGSASQAARQEAARQEAARQDAARQEAARQQAAKPDASKPAAIAGKPSAPDKQAAREPDVLARLIERSDDGSAAAKAAASRKFLVQIGAYSNVQSAKTASDRAAQVGLRPFQETVKTAQGDWIRVRVGPFATRQDAERAQQDLKRAGVTAAIIAL